MPQVDNSHSKKQNIQQHYWGNIALNSEYNCAAKVLLCAKNQV